MAAIQYGSIPSIDITVKNNGASAIADGTVVLIDTANPQSGDTPPGVKVPSSGGGVVGTLGVVIESIGAGKSGKCRVQGVYWGTADGSVTAGNYLQASDTLNKMGRVKLKGAATEQFAQALNTASDGGLVQFLICKAANA